MLETKLLLRPIHVYVVINTVYSLASYMSWEGTALVMFLVFRSGNMYVTL